MNKKLITLALSSGFCVAALANTEQESSNFIQHNTQRYIVKFKSNEGQNTYVNNRSATSANKAAALINFNAKQHALKSLGIEAKRELPFSNAISANLTKDQIKQLSLRDDIEYVEADPIRELQSEQRSYGIPLIQAPLLSDSATGDMKVCIVDTGYDINHPDLPSSANITGEIDMLAADGQRDLGVWYEDSYGHGTHMAGTIAALGSNDIGVAGVNPSGQVNLHIVKILDNSNWWRAYGSDLVAAIDACVDAGSNVINLSIGGHAPSATEEQAMQNAYDAGVLIVSAAGNMGTSDYYYPAAYDSVIAAAAVDKNESVWMFSNNNDQIELAAAGVEVKSTMRDGGYATWDGTSVSSAMISGGLALLWSHHPECSNAEIRNIAQLTAKDKGDAGYDPFYGYGILQVLDASQLINDAGCDGILNYPPTISIEAQTWVSAGSAYSATPVAADPEDDTLIFSATNLPSWLSIDSNTGEIFGSPDIESSTTTYSGIQISVSDGLNQTSAESISITVVASVLGDWVDNGEAHSFGAWLPEISNQSVDFQQSRTYLQPQTRSEIKQGFDAQGQIIAITSELAHQQDTLLSEERPIMVTGEGWVNVNEIYGCGEWLPLVSSVNLGETFTQSQECQQDQQQNVLYYADGAELQAGVVTQTVQLIETQEAVGTMDFIVSTLENCSDPVWHGKEYQTEAFTPSCLDFTSDRFFTQTQPWTQDRIRTCQLDHTWASGATTQEQTYQVEDTLIGQDNNTVQGCQPFVGTWSDSELIGSTACVFSVEEQFPGTPVIPQVGECTQRSEEYYHVGIIEVNSPQCADFDGKLFVGQYKQTCVD